jgi:glycosidase
MPWTGDAPGHGFTDGPAAPWLAVSTPPECNVAAQEDDPWSVLAFTRAAIARRRATPDLALGDYATVPSPEGTWVWRRGSGATVALNLTEDAVKIEGVSGSVALQTTPPFAPDAAPAVEGSLRLEPWCGTVVLH